LPLLVHTEHSLSLIPVWSVAPTKMLGVT